MNDQTNSNLLRFKRGASEKGELDKAANKNAKKILNLFSILGDNQVSGNERTEAKNTLLRVARILNTYEDIDFDLKKNEREDLEKNVLTNSIRKKLISLCENVND